MESIESKETIEIFQDCEVVNLKLATRNKHCWHKLEAEAYGELVFS